jgi:hypothetical protein
MRPSDLSPPPGERATGTHWIRSWVGPRAGLDAVAKRKIFKPLPGIELRNPDVPDRSQSLHRLSYPSSLHSAVRKVKVLPLLNQAQGQKNAWSYTSTAHIRLHGAVLNQAPRHGDVWGEWSALRPGCFIQDPPGTRVE